MILWITGVSGAGKTTLAHNIIKKLKKKFIHIDGDKFRSLFQNDLGYSLEDRNLNAKRLINFVNFLDRQKFNVILSANLTSSTFRKQNKKKFKNYYEINLQSDYENLKKRDKKKIYTKSKNVVGKDIKITKNTTAELIIINNTSKKKLLSHIPKILKLISKLKFY